MKFFQNIKWFAVLSLSGLCLISFLLFQNCSKSSSSGAAIEESTDQSIVDDSDDDDSLPDTPPECTPITSSADFTAITGSLNPSAPKKYCLLNDVDLKNTAPHSAKDIRNIVFEGNNHKIYGLNFLSNHNLFGKTLHNSVIKNLIIGHDTQENSLLISKSQKGILSGWVLNSTLENVTILHPKTNSDVATKTGCGLLVGQATTSNFKGVSINLKDDLALECTMFGILANYLWNQAGGVIDNVTVKSEGLLSLNNTQSMGLLANSGSIRSIKNVTLDISSLQLSGPTKLGAHFGGLMASNLVDNEDNSVRLLENIILMGQFELKNARRFSGLISDCGGITRASKSRIAFKNMSVDASFSIDNSAHTDNSMYFFGGICSSTFGLTNLSYEGRINMVIDLIHLSKNAAQTKIGGVVGSVSGDIPLQIDLELNPQGEIAVTTLAADATKIVHGKIAAESIPPVSSKGDDMFKVLYNLIAL